MKKLLFLTFLLIASCKTEEVRPTVAQQIEEFINSRRAVRIISAETIFDFFNLANQSTRGKSFKIDKNFITIDGVSWNLNKVKSYQIIEVSSNDFVVWLQI